MEVLIFENKDDAIKFQISLVDLLRHPTNDDNLQVCEIYEHFKEGYYFCIYDDILRVADQRGQRIKNFIRDFGVGKIAIVKLTKKDQIYTDEYFANVTIDVSTPDINKIAEKKVNYLEKRQELSDKEKLADLNNKEKAKKD
jgi:hypothetical protein